MPSYDPYAPTSLRPRARGPLAALSARWPLAVLITVVAVGLALVAGVRAPRVYGAEARVAVGYGDLQSAAIAGFPEAAESLAANYSRYINDQGLVNVDSSSIAASPIPSSNVIRIEATGTNPARTKDRVTRAANELIKEVNDAQNSQGPRVLLRQYNKIAAAYSTAATAQTDAQKQYDTAEGNLPAGAPRLAVLSAQLTQASVRTSALGLRKDAAAAAYQRAMASSTSAKLLLVEKGVVTGSNRTSQLQRFGLLGLLAGLLVSLVATSLLERTRASKSERRRDAEPHAA